MKQENYWKKIEKLMNIRNLQHTAEKLMGQRRNLKGNKIYLERNISVFLKQIYSDTNAYIRKTKTSQINSLSL